MPGSDTLEDAIIRLNTIAYDIERRPETERAHALLEFADLVRTLWIMFDSGVDIRLNQTG